MAKFVRGQYAGKSVKEVQKENPRYVREMYQSSMNVFGGNLSEQEVSDIREQQQEEQRARDSY